MTAPSAIDRGALVPAVVREGDLQVIEAHQVHDCSMDVVCIHRVVRGVHSDLVG